MSPDESERKSPSGNSISLEKVVTLGSQGVVSGDANKARITTSSTGSVGTPQSTLLNDPFVSAACQAQFAASGHNLASTAVVIPAHDEERRDLINTVKSVLLNSNGKIRYCS
jgi:hypothetical protein